MTTNLSKDSDLPKSSATGPHSELITAAEKFASLYDGDDREYIKTDVLNSFYAGWDYARKAIAAQTAQSIPDEVLVDVARKTGLRCYLIGVNAQHAHEIIRRFVNELALYAAPPTQAIAVEAGKEEKS